MAHPNRRSGSGGGSVGNQEEDEQKTPPTEDFIYFDEANGEDGFQARKASILHVNSSQGKHLSDNSLFKFKLVVDYAWEQQYIPGRLVATHVGNKIIAYIVHAKGVGAVRIMDLVTQERCLMKADKGEVKDMEFMHKTDDIYIGFVDEYGTFYINRIHQDDQTGKLSFAQIYKVTLDGTPKKSDFRRFIWCKFVPDELAEVATVKDCAYQFTVLQDDIIYTGHLAQMVSEHQEGVYTANELRDTLIVIDTHSGPVTDASFAPDGTALATGSKDGTVKFFQIYFQDQDRNPPRCLYSWEPHQGRPIDRLMFLDNHSIRPTSESQYWKFMLTFAENMTEMKLFTCKTWQCLQTIKFSETGQWKMELDSSAYHLLATDVTKKAMYLIHLEHNDESARVDWVREFSLPFNVISFNVTNASPYRMKELQAKGLADCVAGDIDDYKSDAEMVLIEANIVQPKSLQQAFIAIDPPRNYCNKVNTTQNNIYAPHISFKPKVSYQETVAAHPALVGDDEEDVDDEDEVDVDDDEIVEPTSSAKLNSPASALLLNLSSGSLRKKNSLSPVLDSSSVGGGGSIGSQQGSRTPSVAQMSEQLSSLIGISPGGGLGGGSGAGSGPPSSIHGIVPGYKGEKSPSPVRHSRSVGATGTGGLEDLLSPRELNLEGANGNPGSKASSSSSPSREVEEILSPKNTELLSHRIEPDLEDIFGMKNARSMESLENGNHPTSLIPPLPEKHFQQMKQSFSKPPAGDVLQAQDTSVIVENVSSMMSMIGAQAEELQDLKKDLGKLVVSLKKNDELSSLAKLVEAYFKDSQKKLNRLDESIKKLEAQERSRASQQQNMNSNTNNTSPIPPNLSELLAVSVGAVVKKEIETIVPATIESLFNPARLNVSGQIDNLASVLETKISANIAHIFQREKIWEGVTANFKTVTKSIFEQTFNEIFTNTVYPRCQNAATEMYAQVNEAFTQGTNQYLHGLQEALEKERKKDNTSERLQAHITNMQDALSSALQVEVEAQMLRVLSGLQGSVVRQLEDSISRELSQAFQEQKKYFEISVLPRTVTPAISVSDFPYGVSPNMNDPEQLKRSLLSQAKSGELVTAFVQACNFGEPSVLVHLCKHIAPMKVFEAKLPHQTHISIIQNLVTDLQVDTDTKLQYLNVAITTLDQNDLKMLQSLQRVLPVFQASVSKFGAMNPTSPHLQYFKILEMALVGACQKVPQQQQLHTPLSSSAAHNQNSSGGGNGFGVRGGSQHSFQY